MFRVKKQLSGESSIKNENAKDLLNSKNDVSEINISILAVCGEDVEVHLEKFMEELESFTEMLPENEENKKTFKEL